MRQCFFDLQGRIWCPSSVNNKVGCCYFDNEADTATVR